MADKSATDEVYAGGSLFTLRQFSSQAVIWLEYPKPLPRRDRAGSPLTLAPSSGSLCSSLPIQTVLRFLACSHWWDGKDQKLMSLKRLFRFPKQHTWISYASCQSTRSLYIPRAGLESISRSGHPFVQ